MVGGNKQFKIKTLSALQAKALEAQQILPDTGRLNCNTSTANACAYFEES